MIEANYFRRSCHALSLVICKFEGFLPGNQSKTKAMSLAYCVTYFAGC